MCLLNLCKKSVYEEAIQTGKTSENRRVAEKFVVGDRATVLPVDLKCTIAKGLYQLWRGQAPSLCKKLGALDLECWMQARAFKAKDYVGTGGVMSPEDNQILMQTVREGFVPDSHFPLPQDRKA